VKVALGEHRGGRCEDALSLVVVPQKGSLELTGQF